MHNPTDRIARTTAFVTPVVEHWLEQEIAQWVHPMKDRSDDPSHHEQTLLPWSYILLEHGGITSANIGKNQFSRDSANDKILVRLFKVDDVTFLHKR